MIVNFDTASLNQAEARGLISLLSSLHSIPTQFSAPPASDVPPASDPTPPSNSEPDAVDAPTRKRRTKAEMAADEAAAKAAQSPYPTSASTAAPTTDAAAPASAPSPGASGTTPSKPTASAALNADELRSLLNAFIQKHSMEEAIEKLKAFGCNRVSEALTLAPEKLGELAEALRG